MSTPEQPAAKPPSVSEVLLRILLEQYFIARTDHGEPFAAARSAPSVMVRFRGNGGLRQQLAAAMFRATGKAATSNALTDVLNTAEGIASGWQQPVTPHLRIAEHHGALFLDLGRADGATVHLWPGGWQVVTRPPVLFARTAMTGELPVPAAGGSLNGTRDLINVRGANEWALYIACRVASLFPGITHPVELFSGMAGSAKTATTRNTANWVDPSEVMIPVPRDGRTWAAIAGSRYVLPVDNVSYIPPWWSDLLCKAASGDGWVDRALYTDGDVFVSKFLAVILLNGITFGALRGDLADRIVGHVLVRPPSYRSDDELDRQWAMTHPASLGWLLDRAAETYADMSLMMPPQESDRLARFAQIVRCLDSRWGTNAVAAWRQGKADVLEDVADSDPVAVALRASVHGPVMMTATELLAMLTARGDLEPNGKFAWTPKTLSEHMDRSLAALGSLGWQVWKSREGHARTRVWNIVPPGWMHDGARWAAQR